jgi:hypothetical protein
LRIDVKGGRPEESQEHKPTPTFAPASLGPHYPLLGLAFIVANWGRAGGDT